MFSGALSVHGLYPLLRKRTMKVMKPMKKKRAAFLTSSVDWNRIATYVFQGYTVPQAIRLLGYDQSKVNKLMGANRRTFLVELSLLAKDKKVWLYGKSEQERH
jgi:hypothetical protein